MKECDIFEGSKHTLTPSTYFQGSGPPISPGSTPLHSARNVSVISVTAALRQTSDHVSRRRISGKSAVFSAPVAGVKRVQMLQQCQEAET